MKEQGDEGVDEAGGRFRGRQQVKRSFLWNNGFGLYRIYKSGTAWAAWTGMRSEMVKDMGNATEMESQRFQTGHV